MMTALRALVRKDLLLFRADRRALLMSFALPIALAAFIGYVTGGRRGDPETSRISVLAVDQDSSTISREIVHRLSDEKSLAVKAATRNEGREAVRKGTATVAIVIPKDFGSDAGRAFFRSGQKPQLTILYDPSHAAERGMVEGILAGDVMQAVSQEMFTGESGQAVVNDALADVERSQDLQPDEKKTLEDMLRSVERWNQSSVPARRTGGLSIPFQTHDEAVTARRGVLYNGYGHAFAGMTVQFVLFFGIDIGIGLLLQRQRGLWKRFRAAPLSRATLLGSRALSAAILSFFILLVNYTFARWFFGVRIEGSMAGFLAVCAALSLMTGTFGLLVAALGKTPEATRGLAIFVTLIIVMLGGAWFPTFLLPQWLQKATLAVPTRWAIDGLEAMTWRGLGFSAALAPVAALLGFALLFGLLTAMRFRWEAE